MENFSDLIKNRRSMRKFTDEELTQRSGAHITEGGPDGSVFQTLQLLAVHRRRRQEHTGKIIFL